MPTQLNEEVVELLSGMDSFFIQQRLQLAEAITQGCCEQQNVYDVFDHNTNKRIMIIKEESPYCSRMSCGSQYSVFLKFYVVGKDAPELKPGEKVDWSYDPADRGSPFMTFERDGCDCCFEGTCPKPCICCFAVNDSCQDEGKLYVGDISGKPGSGNGDKSKILGASVQPPGGGGFKPLLQIMERADANDSEGKMEMFAATRGPACFGGCSKFCFESEFGMAKADQSLYDNSSMLHKQNFGDFATLKKLTPKKFGQAMREAFTDSDLFDIQFTDKSITPQQKANVLAHMIHLDFMFFENDNDMCETNGDGTTITFFNCYVYGCVCPCNCHLPRDSGSS